MLPTGATYEVAGGFYEILREDYKDAIDWSRVIVLNLDEYVGLSPHDQRSFHYKLMRAILNPLNIPLTNIHLFLGNVMNIDWEIKRREKIIADLGGIDICLLGYGTDKHIAFNMIGSERDSKTRVVRLTLEARGQNAPYFSGAEKVPERAITVGIETILSARKIIFLASGVSKAAAVNSFLEAEDPLLNPACYLYEHPDAIFIFDQEAVSLYNQNLR